MNNFDYYAPTKVLFGKDTEKETGRLVKEQGASSVLVHFGGKSAIASGLIDVDLEQLLQVSHKQCPLLLMTGSWRWKRY